MSQSSAVPATATESSSKRVNPSIKLFNGVQDTESKPIDGSKDVGSVPLLTYRTFPSSPSVSSSASVSVSVSSGSSSGSSPAVSPVVHATKSAAVNTVSKKNRNLFNFLSPLFFTYPFTLEKRRIYEGLAYHLAKAVLPS